MRSAFLFIVITANLVNFSHLSITPDFIRRHGYPVESYEVETVDGYILVMHRIPCNTPGKLPVLIQHGIIGSSDHYVITGPKQGLIFQLHDAGYDVWLANMRGNTYTKKNRYLSPNSQQFWNYTFHELAIYDLPAMVNHVLKTTYRNKLHYIGHSQGTTTILILLSELPDYNRVIQSVTLLAPVAFVGNLKDPNVSSVFRYFAFTFIAPELGTPNPDFDKIGSYEVFPNNKEVGRISTNLCLSNVEACKEAFKLGGAMGTKHFQERIVEDAFSIFPSSSSINQFVHYAQLFVSNRFAQYDWGSEYRNYLKYGQPIPPDYRLENIVSPVNIFYSDDDAVVSPKDVRRLMARLPNVNFVKFIQNEGWQHFDYIWSRYTKQFINDEILLLLNKS
ncbi:hypothetical protein ACFFRR_011760 [Megaselia abdita]